MVEEKKIVNNKRLGLTIGILLLCSVFVFAGVVTYLSNSVTTNIDVDSPVALEPELFDVNIQYGGEYSLALLKIENRANVPITGDVVITLNDVSGFNLAISEDISYCYKGQGDMTNVTNCDTEFEQWVTNNPEWVDWYASSSYDSSVYEAPYVIDYEGNSFVDLGGYTGNTLVLPDQTIPANTTVYGNLYVDTESSLTPGDYILEVQLMVN